jgi:hypothetical protein
MTLNPGGATLNTAIPVGWCREWPSERQIVPMDSGGDCLDYVVEGTLTVDLTWTPTSRLFSGSSTDSFGSPGESVTTLRYTGQYRDASVAGDLGLPNIGSFAVTSEFGTIYTGRWARWSFGSVAARASDDGARVLSIRHGVRGAARAAKSPSV